MKKGQNYTATISVEQTPEEVFAAINNPRGWWSEEIEGSTDKPGAIFHHHHQDIHRCKMKITEFVPGKKVVWRVMENYFNFIKDQQEWVGTDIVFEITKKNGKTLVQFTHVGLVPAYECYELCSNAWGSFINGSLRDLITKGKGHPTPLEEATGKSHQSSNRDYTISLTVNQSPDEAFAAINNVGGWWSGAIEGEANRPGAEFNYSVPSMHWSKQRVTEFIPGKKVVWHVLDAKLTFVKNKTEWKGTDIVFEIGKKNAKTELRFTHVGLAPDYECYESCSNAWGLLVNGNLRKLITTGKPQPSPW